MADAVEVDDRGGATVTLNRTEVNNAHDEAMPRRLRAAVHGCRRR